MLLCTIKYRVFTIKRKNQRTIIAATTFVFWKVWWIWIIYFFSMLWILLFCRSEFTKLYDADIFCFSWLSALNKWLHYVWAISSERLRQSFVNWTYNLDELLYLGVNERNKTIHCEVFINSFHSTFKLKLNNTEIWSLFPIIICQ